MMSEYLIKGSAMRIYNWQIIAGRICGYLPADRRYPNGAYVETSRIVSAAGDDDVVLIKTRNTIYECRMIDYKGSKTDLEEFLRKMRQDRDIDDTQSFL